MIGAGAGQIQGLLLGQLVEVIDDKVNMKRSASQEALIEKRQDYEHINHNYHVIHHLVMRFKKDILKPGNFEHLIEANNLRADTLLKNANEIINEEDYDIYLITAESMDAPANDEIGSDESKITNRNSIEVFSASQLPDDLNIYFKMNEI